MNDNSSGQPNFETLALKGMQQRFRRAAKKICKRLDIEYCDDEGSIQYYIMLSVLGARFIFDSKEFTEAKRGRTKDGLSQAEKYALIADSVKDHWAAIGVKISDREIANKIADDLQAADPNSRTEPDPFIIAQQISRGRRKLRPNEK